MHNAVGGCSFRPFQLLTGQQMRVPMHKAQTAGEKDKKNLGPDTAVKTMGRCGERTFSKMRYSRKNLRGETLNRSAAFTPLQCAKFLQYRKLKQRERRPPPAGSG
jgi:hypothetical protein